MSAGERLPGTPVPDHKWEGAGGVMIAGDSWGDPKSPLVMLLHGGGQTRHAWKGAGETLGKSGYHAIAFDARGHGDSDWAAAEAYGSDYMVEDLRCVAAALGSGPPILVGASMGGGVSLMAIGEGKIDAAALVLVDMAPKIEAEGRRKIQKFMDQKPDGFDSLEEVAEAIANYQPHRKRPRNLDGLAKNVRLGANGKYRWHWDPRAPRELAQRYRLPGPAEQLRRQFDPADAAGPRRPVERIKRSGRPEFPRPMPACGICQCRERGAYGRRRPQRYFRRFRNRISATRRPDIVSRNRLARIIHGGDWIFARRTVPAGLTAIFEAGFQNGLEVEVRGSSGNACRVVQGPWAAIRPAIEIMALR